MTEVYDLEILMSCTLNPSKTLKPLFVYLLLLMKTKILELIDKKRKAYITNIYDQRNLTITVCMFDNFIEKLRQEIRQELEKMENETIKIIDKMIEEYQHCP